MLVRRNAQVNSANGPIAFSVGSLIVCSIVQRVDRLGVSNLVIHRFRAPASLSDRPVVSSSPEFRSDTPTLLYSTVHSTIRRDSVQAIHPERITSHSYDLR